MTVAAFAAGHTAEFVCNSLYLLHALLSLLTGFPCLLITLNFVQFVCHSRDLSTYSYFDFMIPLPKGNLSLFLGSPSRKRESECLFCLFTTSMDELHRAGWSSPD